MARGCFHREVSVAVRNSPHRHSPVMAFSSTCCRCAYSRWICLSLTWCVSTPTLNSACSQGIINNKLFFTSSLSQPSSPWLLNKGNFRISLKKTPLILALVCSQCGHL